MVIYQVQRALPWGKLSYFSVIPSGIFWSYFTSKIAKKFMTLRESKILKIKDF